MNCHQLIGNLKQVKGAVGEGEGKLTGDNVDAIAGKRDIPLDKIQERHGITCEQAERSSRSV
ncbi:MAG: hypothetical protein ACLQBD_09815 [Syntrophobacteraceae bacterium]